VKNAHGVVARGVTTAAGMVLLTNLKQITCKQKMPVTMNFDQTRQRNMNMNDMNKNDWLDIMQSDNKLWELAEKQDNSEGGITLTLRGIPWGIGDVEVNMEGLEDAGKRRQAVGAFAGYIREVIDEKIDDEAVEARAAQAAALASPDPSELLVDVGEHQGARGVGGKGEPVQTMAREETVPSFEQPTTGQTDPAVRLSVLRDGVQRAQSYIASASTEIKALEAYEAIMQNASEEEAS
jgi:hypothetical protein